MSQHFHRRSVEFPSAYPLAESVARLKAATRRSAFSAMAEQAAVGRVSERRVSMRRCIPLVGNSFKPLFIGRFVVREGGVVLVGEFRMLLLVRVFLAVWFAALAVGTVLWAAVPEPHRWAGVGTCIAMIVTGMGITRLGKWFARNDVAYLSAVIRNALCAGPASVVPLKGPGRDVVRRWIAAACVALAGITWTAAAMRAGAESGHLADLLRILAALDGAMLLLIALGAWKKRPFGWRLGFAFLALSWAQMLVQVLVDPTFKAPPAIAALFAIASTLVVALWGWWWRAQRVHFESPA